jgi:hypothetical protein
MRKSDGFRDCGLFPRKVPAGRVLAHNEVQHTNVMNWGTYGFRCWTWPKEKVPRDFVNCPCGWSGLPHVAPREHVMSSKSKCITTYRQIRNGGVSAEKARNLLPYLRKYADELEYVRKHGVSAAAL